MKNLSAKSASLDMERWRDIIESWNKSGENQKVYCQRLGISLNTFTYARSKLRKKDKPKTQFIPLTIKSSGEEKTLLESITVLENPRGYKLHFSTSLSLEQLTKLFKLSGWDNA
jgi:hypothetical protein